MVLTSQEKWDGMKNICRFWLDLLNQGVSKLDHKLLRSDHGFMVYAAQAYPWMKPYLKGFHLSLESWRDDRISEGWKIHARPALEEDVTGEDTSDEGNFIEIKIQLLTNSLEEEESRQDSPRSGLTPAVPCFKEDHKATLQLAEGEQPALCCVRSMLTMTAYYVFGDAFSGGFGATVERLSGLYGR